MKHCAECGNEIQEDERFCSNCGTPVSGSSEAGDSVEKHWAAMEALGKEAANNVQQVDEEKEERTLLPEESEKMTNKSSQNQQGGAIGCAALLLILFLIFKGCGFFFGADDKKQIKQSSYYNSNSNSDSKYSTGNNATSFDSYRPDPKKFNASTYEVMLWRCTYCGEMRITHRYGGSPSKPSNAKRCPSSTLADQSHLWIVSRHKVYGWNPNARQWVIMTDMIHR